VYLDKGGAGKGGKKGVSPLLRRRPFERQHTSTHHVDALLVLPKSRRLAKLGIILSAGSLQQKDMQTC
jgi:hypothetical protein